MKFQHGDRVKAKTVYKKFPDRLGTVVKHQTNKQVQVLWDGNKTISTISENYLELANDDR